MLNKFFFLCLCFQIYSVSQAKRTKWAFNYGCRANLYTCQNDICIGKSQYCNGVDDCGDNSDEMHCAEGYKSSLYPEFLCGGHFSENNLNFIPEAWVCDGEVDCATNIDETNCENIEIRLADAIDQVMNSRPTRWEAGHWLLNHNHHGGWGVHAPRIAAIIPMLDPEEFRWSNMSTVIEEISREIETLSLARLFRNSTDPISMNELALYINALIATCANPKDFHGIDLVAKLRHQADSHEDYINPLVPLALCNAEDTMTKKDVEKLIHVFDAKKRTNWLSTQALALMALGCIAKLPHSPVEVSSVMNDMSIKLKKHQESDGGFGNTYTTALVMQALFASDTEEEGGWNMIKAVKYLVKHYNNDGTFGDILTTYSVLPVLCYKSLADISSEHCHHQKANHTEDQHDLNLGKKKVLVKYTLQVADEVDLSYYLDVHVVENSTLFDVMNAAKDMAKIYDFEYTLIDSKPHVFKLGGFHDDAENDKYWFLYKADENGHVSENPINSSPADIIPTDGEEYVMWYRSGKWTHH